jgi:tetratricopeptide (TPR) repeat protein
MSSQLPVAKQIAWVSVIPQILILLCLIVAADRLNFDFPAVAGSVAYLALSLLLRRLIAYRQRRGMRLLQMEKFAEAIPQFQASYDFFTKHQWIDRWRYVVLLSSSRITFREMALVNMAFCFGQMGDGKMARELYEKTLREFPDSKMASSALRLLNAVQGA